MRVALYVPTIDQNGNPAPNRDDVLAYTETALARLNGGATSYPGTGSWIDDAGQLVREPVTIVESFADAIDRDAIGEIAATIKDLLQQDAVAYVAGDTLTLI